MDRVDEIYKGNIIDALNSQDLEKIKQLVPSLTDYEAQDYLNRYQGISQVMMEKIRASIDTTNESEAQWQIIYTLLDKANLSGYKREGR